nr:crossover junction endodeoxyribonuclease RuvC [Nakamurella leprariae]
MLVRVLGIDPGLTRCGVGVVDGEPGAPLRMVDVTVVRTSPDEDIAHRLLLVAQEVEQLLDRHRPDTVAVERMFSQANVRTVMGTAQAAGVVSLAAARRGIPVAWHTPSEVKAAVSGNGRAEKAQVATMVTRLLRLPAAPTPADASDALALAICQLWKGPVAARLLEQGGARRTVRPSGAAMRSDRAAWTARLSGHPATRGSRP